MNKNFWQKHQQDVLTAAIVLACLLLFTFFPTNGASQKITVGLVFLCVVPLLYLKSILGKKFRAYGWQIGDWKSGVVFAAIYFVAALSVSWLLFRYTGFSKAYALPAAAAGSFWYFIFYEIVLVGMFIALYEIFFRGFIMFSLSGRTGTYAIFYQFLLFFLFLAATGNLDWNNVPFLFIALFSGWVTFKSTSLLYSTVASILYMIIFDALTIKFLH